jgi:hypothetical protein
VGSEEEKSSKERKKERNKMAIFWTLDIDARCSRNASMHRSIAPHQKKEKRAGG